MLIHLLPDDLAEKVVLGDTLVALIAAGVAVMLLTMAYTVYAEGAQAAERTRAEKNQ